MGLSFVVDQSGVFHVQTQEAEACINAVDKDVDIIIQACMMVFDQDDVVKLMDVKKRLRVLGGKPIRPKSGYWQLVQEAVSVGRMCSFLLEETTTIATASIAPSTTAVPSTTDNASSDAEVSKQQEEAEMVWVVDDASTR